MNKTILLICLIGGYSLSASIQIVNTGSDTLAVVGSKVITSEDFKTQYKKII